MEAGKITETRIGTTTYTVERVFNGESKESALQAIRRLLLRQAKTEGQGKLSERYQDSLAGCETVWLYGRNAGKEE